MYGMLHIVAPECKQLIHHPTSFTMSVSSSSTPRSFDSISAVQMQSERSDEYFMNVYKVAPCTRTHAHDWASCPAKHKGERAARRSLSQHLYMPIACHYAQQRMECPLGDRCSYAHNMFEYWLHPQRYKTELCQFGAKCHRSMCFYAHGVADLRPLDPTLPPPELSWSAGAAFTSKASSSSQQRQQQPKQRQQHAQGGVPARQGSSSTCYTGPPTPESAAMRVEPVPVASQQLQQLQQQQQQQLQLQQQQQAQVAVITSIAACNTPRTPSLSPAASALYTQQPPLQQQLQQQQLLQQQQQQQPQVVVLLAGQGASGAATAAGASVSIQEPLIASPEGNLSLPMVLPAGGMHAGIPMPAVQPLVQQVSLPSNPQTYILQPVTDACSSTSSSSCAQVAAGQVVQVSLPAGTFITAADLSVQGCAPAGQNQQLLLPAELQVQQQQQQPSSLQYVCPAASMQAAGGYVLVDPQTNSGILDSNVRDGSGSG